MQPVRKSLVSLAEDDDWAREFNLILNLDLLVWNSFLSSLWNEEKWQKEIYEAEI